MYCTMSLWMKICINVIFMISFWGCVYGMTLSCNFVRMVWIWQIHMVVVCKYFGGQAYAVQVLVPQRTIWHAFWLRHNSTSIGFQKGTLAHILAPLRGHLCIFWLLRAQFGTFWLMRGHCFTFRHCEGTLTCVLAFYLSSLLCLTSQGADLNGSSTRHSSICFGPNKAP